MKKFIIFIFFITIACSSNKVVNNHGLLALEKKANKIEISKTNKNEILTTIGNPSTKSLFDDEMKKCGTKSDLNSPSKS